MTARERVTNIEGLYAGSWDNAIKQVAEVLNRTLNTNYTAKDWDKLENLALKLDIKFNEDGEIVSERA